MKKEIKTEIVINASQDDVYSAITDLSSYEDWNPFIIRSEGKAKLGSRIKNTMLNGEKKMVFKPTVVKAQKGKCFEWLGSLWVKGLFDGHHYFHIKNLDSNRVNLIHGERFSGILSSFILRKIKKNTQNGFISMNQALKEFVESKN